MNSVIEKEIPDAKARKDALDITRSFLVQAPAGSGKTELLTQRFLTLLSSVETPEEIIAITFTKKAAHEMRSRILSSLANAKTEAAKKAFSHSNKKKWNLYEHPNRLRILTLDALSLQIAQQLPISSKLGAQLNITENPQALYQEAVRKIILNPTLDAPWLDDIKNLLLNLDNDYYRLETLLIDLLSKRDQWLPIIVHHSKNNCSREFLEQELQHINHGALKKINEIPSFLINEILAIAEYAVANLSMPIVLDKNKKETWIFISDMLFTKNDQLRKRVDKNNGFPSASESKNKDEKKTYDAYKKRFHELTTHLYDYPDVLKSIIDIRYLPETYYTQSQWQVLSALLILLPLTAAQLRLLFSQYGEVDFIENAQSALYAMGTDEDPTSLSLKLDYQIHHLLIDEFQDTSNSQFQLLEKLTYGWTENDGRTLFLVGDPMQSIYRFRQAEVGLFLHAKHHGIGHVKCHFLSLTSNFRSAESIIHWINRLFSDLFPKKENMQSGAIPYSPAVAVNTIQSNDDNGVECFYFHDSQLYCEENFIVDKILSIKEKNPQDTIAILIRSRNHLKKITPLLKKYLIEYQAVDIEGLSHKMLIHDLLSLTKACIYLSDRVSWLACLRAPWCGLTLNDLWSISHDSKNKTIWEQLNNSEIINRLSQDGKCRATHFRDTISLAIEQRERFSLRHLVEKIWLRLCAKDINEDDDSKQFFLALDSMKISHGVFDIDAFEKKIANLFSVSRSCENNPVQIMTIHKSKGLEFDHVFLPALNKQTISQEKSLITWLEYPDDENVNHLLMAPITTIPEENKTYDYIQKQLQEKMFLEMDRVLYVAVTRAKKHLYLTGTLPAEETTLTSRSFLGRIWQQYPDLFQVYSRHEETPAQVHQHISPHINRLAIHLLKNQDPFKKPDYSTEQTNVPYLEFTSFSDEAKLGTLIHRVIEQIGERGTKWWLSLSAQKIQAIILALCSQYNLFVQDAANKITLAIDIMLKDPQGQWILQAHRRAYNEFQLYHYDEQGQQWDKKRIDRLIVDELGQYWIIDYKTSEKPDLETSIQQFLSLAAERHRPQLYTYRETVKQILSIDTPIKMALYFPLLPAWYVYPN